MEDRCFCGHARTDHHAPVEDEEEFCALCDCTEFRRLGTRKANPLTSCRKVPDANKWKEMFQDGMTVEQIAKTLID